MKIKRLLLNSLSITLVRPLSLLINLAAFPVLIEAFGKELFGIYILAVTFASSIVSFDFGIQSNIVKVVAESRTTGNVLEAQKVVKFASKIYWITGAIFLSVALLVGFKLEFLFKISPLLHEPFFWVALHAGVASVLIIRLKVEEAILDAYEFHFVRNLVALIPAVGTLVIIYYVQHHQLGFSSFVSLSFFFLILPGFANWVARHWMKLLTGSYDLSAPLPPDFIKNSKNTFITQALAFLNLAGQQFFVGIVMGPAAVASFASATRPVFMLRIMTSQTALPLMPQIVSLLKLGKTTEAIQFIKNANALILIIILSVALPLATCSELFFRTWLNSDAVDLANLSNVAILGLVLSGCTGVVSRYFVFAGEPQRLAVIQGKCSLLFIISAPASLYWGGLDYFLWVIALNALIVSGLVFKEYVNQLAGSWNNIYPIKLCVWLIAAGTLCSVARFYVQQLPAQWIWIGLTVIPMGLGLGVLAFLVFRKEIQNALRKSKIES